MRTSRKIMVVLLITAFLFATAQVVFAEAGISLIDLLRSKAEFLVGIDTNNAATQLEETKQETIKEATGYIDSFISNMQSSLSQYTQQEVDAAKVKIKAKAQEVKSAVDSQSPEVIEQAKIKIKTQIEQETIKTLSELDNELSVKISSQ